MTLALSEVAKANFRRCRIEKITLPLFVVASLGACATAPLSQVPPAGLPAAVPAPTIAAGDSWTYRVQDGFTRLPRADQRFVVDRVDAGRIEVAGPAEPAGATQIYDREWNWIRRPATALQTFDYSPAYPAYGFPLAPGKRWNARVTATDPRDGRRFPVRVGGAVLGWEHVKVPAGEFDALKIERIVYFDYWEYALRGHSIIREYEWYVPSVKWSVKRETMASYLSYTGALDTAPRFVRVDDDQSGGPRYVRDDWLIYELSSFTVR
jgi:hypothetical protein